MAKYALITHHDPGYQKLADETWHNNKLLYAARHGYATHARTDNFVTRQPDGLMTGFEKIYLAKQTLEDHPEYEWIWWTGTDTMITNFSTRLEDRVNNAYHYMVCVDINGINSDSFLVRNTPEGRGVLDAIIAQESDAMKFWDTEQRATATILGFPGTSDPGWPSPADLTVADKYKDIVKILPQRYMNSFNYQLYHYTVHNDKLGYDGNWQIGDWLIHWPGTNLDLRMQLAPFYKQHIIM
jgi:hypothetical protein